MRNNMNKYSLYLVICCCLIYSLDNYSLIMHDYFCEPFLSENIFEAYTNRSITYHNFFEKPFFSNDHESNPARTFEYAMYQLLKRNPLQSNINYFAYPWVEALFNGYSKQVVIQGKYNLLPMSKVNGGFTIIGSGSFFSNQTWKRSVFSLLQKVGINVIFTPAASKSLQQSSPVKIEPLPFQVVEPVIPSEHKDLICSFIGDPKAHPTRQVLTELANIEYVVIILRSNDFYHISEKQQQEWRREYNDTLARSRYSLCPRGVGAGSVRFWESLQAGAIPIVISDDGLLPEGFDWAKCTIKIDEQEFIQNPMCALDRIKQITPSKEDEMRASCFQAYEAFSGDNLINPIRKYYDKN